MFKYDLKIKKKVFNFLNGGLQKEKKLMNVFNDIFKDVDELLN